MSKIASRFLKSGKIYNTKQRFTYDEQENIVFETQDSLVYLEIGVLKNLTVYEFLTKFGIIKLASFQVYNYVDIPFFEKEHEH